MTDKDTSSNADGGEQRPGDVMGLLKQFDFLSIGLKGKIHCALTGRDLPLRVDAINQHVNSKKLKKEREWYKSDFSQYEPLIVPHKTNLKLLVCTLTGIELNRIPKEVEKHVQGKRFLNRKKEMEGLKVSQREPAKAPSDDEFWAPGSDAESEPEGEQDDDMEGTEDDQVSDDVEPDEEMTEAHTAEGAQVHKKTNRKQQRSDGQEQVRLNKGKGRGKTGRKGKTHGQSPDSRAEKENGHSGATANGKGEQRTKGKKGGDKINARKGPQKAAEVARHGTAEPLGDENKSKTNGSNPAKTTKTHRGKGGEKKTPPPGKAGEGGRKGAAVSPAEKRRLNANEEPSAEKKKRRA